MTLRNYILSSFDGIALHDGVNRFAVDHITEVAQAQSQIITLPSGQKFDSTPTDEVVPLIPGTVTGEISIKEASKAGNQTTFGQIADKLGHYGTLTVKHVESATYYSANARMTAVRNMTPIQAPTAVGYLRIYVAFELLENLT